MVSMKASSLTPDELSIEPQKTSGKLKSPEITKLLNWSQTSCRKLSNTSINLSLHWVAYSKNRIKLFDQRA